MYCYIPVKEELFSEDIGFYTAYGIRAIEKTDSSCKEVAFVSDVSTDPFFVGQLAERCTAHRLDPIHLMDVIENEI